MLPGYVQIAGGYYMIESGSCGNALISTKSECDAAATALDLSEKTAYDLTSWPAESYSPPGCQLYTSPFTSSRYLYFWGGGNTGPCSSSAQCICKFTPPPSPPALPPSPPSPPSPPPPPMPPGYLQIAGGYYMIESGSCGGDLISTVSECEAAATALDLFFYFAIDETSFYNDYAPPGCSFRSTYGELKLFGHSWSQHSRSCSSSRQCICKSTPP